MRGCCSYSVEWALVAQFERDYRVVCVSFGAFAGAVVNTCAV